MTTVAKTKTVKKIEKRAYQQRDVKAIHDAWKDYNRILFQLPTGGGKSVIVSNVVSDLIEEKNPTILVLAHRKELITQMVGHLANRKIVAGKIQAQNIENLDSNIIVASIYSINNDKYDELLESKKFDYVIVDEAHHIASGTYVKIIDKMQKINQKLRLLGVTATPYRKDAKKLFDHFDHLICSEDIQTLINDGYLANFKVFFTPVANIDGEVISYQTDYQMASLSAYMRKPEMIQYLIRSYEKHGQGKQMIVFCCDKKHANEVNAAYKEAGYTKIGHIDSGVTDKARDFVLEQFTKGNIQIITCIETLTEGVDLPETGCIQLARPTRSLTLYMQMVGRGLRVKEDGSDLIVLDGAGCTVKYGTPARVRNWSLDPDVDPAESKKNDGIVVGVREDGTFTRKEEEMEHCEIREITEDEFFEQSTNAVEEAEKMNRELDDDTKARVKAFAEQIIQYLDEKDKWTAEPDRYDSDSFTL